VGDCLCDSGDSNERSAAGIDRLRICRHKNLAESHASSLAYATLEMIHMSNFATEPNLADGSELRLDWLIERC
jgi:hypothetical protein